MKRKKSKSKKFFKKKKSIQVLQAILGLFVTLFLSGILGVFGIFAFYGQELPPKEKIGELIRKGYEQETTTKIFDRSGEHLLYEFGEIKRESVPLEEIPQTIQDATIAIEDWEFYDHSGITARGVTRPIRSTLFGMGTLGGGSTITQQVVRNGLLTWEFSLKRKVKEIILALELEQQ